MTETWKGRGRPEDAPWPRGLFVPHPDGHEGTEELSEPGNEDYQHLAFQLLGVLFDLDFEAVTVAGQIDDTGHTLALVVFERDHVLTSADVHAPWGGRIRVEAREGREIREAIRRDLGEALASSWLVANGYDPGYPAGITTTVGEHGSLFVEVHPLW